VDKAIISTLNPSLMNAGIHDISNCERGFSYIATTIDAHQSNSKRMGGVIQRILEVMGSPDL